MINNRGETFIIQANCPEVAFIKAGRMGDLGWHIVEELSDTQYCYTVTKKALSKECDKLTNEIFHYFKSRMADRYYNAYLHAEVIEELIGISDHDDIVRYVINNY
jgi:hypothetical protein